MSQDEHESLPENSKLTDLDAISLHYQKLLTQAEIEDRQDKINQRNIAFWAEQQRKINKALLSPPTVKTAEQLYHLYEKTTPQIAKDHLKKDFNTFLLDAAQARQPKWAKWDHVPEVELWAAVALSFDVEPERVQRVDKDYDGGPPKFGEGDEFADRMFIARANLSVNPKLPVRSITMGNQDRCTVRVEDFAAWAISVKWEIPEQLAIRVTLVPEVALDPKAQGEDASEKPKHKEATLIAIIGALLMEYSLTGTSGKLSQNDVIKTLLENYSQIPGLKRATLETVFAKANRSIKMNE
ncbi:hypothetical protein OVY01_13560 [Robbsia sp. Bb-Pol-6]|uniref:Uncharacterized protein n=1 Tax=Robbsia betulipollinis TaxID=2981849 RepID=A0ABT3ZNX1_9BURK|nr:hypothetical protein [Robbsia betulipollinis]MCY0388246.1 hypothetical protein [Robbsia betulipollinis]